MSGEGEDTQRSIFDIAPSESATHGPDFETDIDKSRVSDQLSRIRTFMLAAKWKTLAEIEAATGDPEASVSAQLRHLRKTRFGAYIVVKRRRKPTSGTWEYRVLDPRWVDAFDHHLDRCGRHFPLATASDRPTAGDDSGRLPAR